MWYLIASLAFTLIRELLFLQERKQWQQERQKLLDRIQAKDLTEYKILTEPSKSVENGKEDEEIYEFV